MADLSPFDKYGTQNMAESTPPTRGDLSMFGSAWEPTSPLTGPNENFSLKNLGKEARGENKPGLVWSVAKEMPRGILDAYKDYAKKEDEWRKRPDTDLGDQALRTFVEKPLHHPPQYVVL